MILIRQLIGVVALALVGLFFVVSEIWGRLVVTPFVYLFPLQQERALRAHYTHSNQIVLWILRGIGRARFDVRPRIPCRGGILIVMNHQSLVDIPVAASMIVDGVPRFVTHHRYARGVPLISYMIRMSGSIPVYPGQTGTAELARLAEVARTAERPIVLYPEGHRTRDGEIRPWKRGALDAFLSARAWTVHVVVIDGLWKSARIPEFAKNLTQIRCRVESAGVFEYDDRGGESQREFTERMRSAMCDKLSAMRREDALETAARGDERANPAEPARSG
jgi:1-acyl-sn-glycerol-3-phosphate acyltransferase